MNLSCRWHTGRPKAANRCHPATTDDDAELNEETIAGLIPNNTGGTSGGTLPDPVQAETDFHNAANTADDALDQANADAEDDRVTAVTGVRDGLNSGLETADVTWGGTMDAAGAALGSALDGIQDFDWQHVRNYVGAVTGARRAAEIGALTAQVGFVTSYTGAVNNYTASIATASVTHATGYAQATADYYVDTAEQEATTAEADLAAAITNGASASEIAALTSTATAKRAKADAFSTFAPTYVTHLITQAQTAATTAVANVTSENTTALATITTEVATATTEINTFYNNQIATAANPQPVDTDLDNDGIPDPVAPTATQSITASINTAKTADTTARTTIHTAFADQTARRETRTTNTYTTPTTGGSTGSGGNTGTGGVPTPYQTPGVTPPVVPLPPTTPGSGNPGSGLPPAFGGSGPTLAQKISELEEERDALEANLRQPVGHGTEIYSDQVTFWKDRLNEVNEELRNTGQQQTADANLAAALERARRGVERVPDGPSMSPSTSTASPQTLEIARAMQDALDDHRRWGRPSDRELYLYLCQLHRESLAEDFKWSSNYDLYGDQPTYGILTPPIGIDTFQKPPFAPDPDEWERPQGIRLVNGRILIIRGTVGIGIDGTWTYTNAEGKSVPYPGGYADFRAGGHYIREVDIGEFGSKSRDRYRANRLLRPRTPNTVIEHYPGNNWITGEVDSNLHKEFTHQGGRSRAKGGGLPWSGRPRFTPLQPQPRPIRGK